MSKKLVIEICSMKKKKISVIKILLFAIMLYILLGFFNPLVTVKYDLSFDNLPEQMEGYKIVQITDFHCKEFGNKEDKLVNMVKNCEPDLIVLTGDFVDEKHTTENARYLLEGIKDIAPIYYVTGNHEFYSGSPYPEFRDICEENGITILENETVEIKYKDTSFLLTGLDFVNSVAHMKDVIGYADNSYFNVLLYHDSSKFNFLSEYGYDLEFAGHGHGGLIRLPLVGGLLGSDYHLFPKYDYGIFKEKNTTMVNSSGLGDARVPRWNNPREIVLVTLHKK